MRSGQSISDYYAGMLCAFSIVSALHYRHRTGKGQRIDLALLDSLVIALDNLGERYTVGGELLTRAATSRSAGPARASTRPRWPRGHRGRGQRRGVAPILRDHRPGRPQRDSRFATAAARRDRRDQVAGIIQGWTGQRAKAEVVRILSSGGVPAAPVNNVAEMVADPQVQAREMFVELIIRSMAR